MRGDVVSVELPYPADRSTREQSGRRPAIAVLSDSSPASNPMMMVVPLTSNRAALRYPYTLEVLPSPSNGLSVVSVLLVFQLRALDKNRVGKVLGRLEDIYLSQLDQLIRDLLAIN